MVATRHPAGDPHAMFLYFAIPALAIVVILILLVLFEPGLDYAVEAPQQPLDSDDFLCLMGALSDAQVRRARRTRCSRTGRRSTRRSSRPSATPGGASTSRRTSS